MNSVVYVLLVQQWFWSWNCTVQAIFAQSFSSGGIMNMDTFTEASEVGSSLDAVVVGSFATSLKSPRSALRVILVSRPLPGGLATVLCFHHLRSRVLTVARWSPNASQLSGV